MSGLYVMATLASGQVVQWRGLSTNPVNRVYTLVLVVWWVRMMLACGDKSKHGQLTKELIALVVAAVFIGMIQPHETALKWVMP